MAFEDRSSPNAATSPTSKANSNPLSAPNSPESTRTTSPYTCTTITRTPSPSLFTKSTTKSDFLRITSYALSSPREQPSTSPPQPTANGNDIQPLKYSIRNILQPDFGKTALQKTKPKITFKPYEKDVAPLGGLCQTISQIGRVSPVNLEKSPPTKPPASSPNEEKNEDGKLPTLWPAWVYCTRYSDRPSSGPRSRRMKKTSKTVEEKRPRTAFSGAQLARLKHEFAENRYLTERRRQQLSQELGLNEAQIKIWFQNKRAKIKKANGQKNPLALQLMAQGLYNHSTVACDDDDIPINP